MTVTPTIHPPSSNRQWDRLAQVPYGDRVGVVGDSMSVIAALAISYSPRLP
jgi:hypothetical protein